MFKPFAQTNQRDLSCGGRWEVLGAPLGSCSGSLAVLGGPWESQGVLLRPSKNLRRVLRYSWGSLEGPKVAPGEAEEVLYGFLGVLGGSFWDLS